MEKKEVTGEERKKLIEEFCKIDEEKVNLVQKFKNGYNKLLMEIYNSKEDINFDEYCK